MGSLLAIEPPMVPQVAHRRIADQAGELGERRDRLLHHRRRWHVGVAGHGADGDGAAARLDPGRPSMRDEIDKHRRAGEPQLHGRQQGVTAGEELGVLVLAQRG